MPGYGAGPLKDTPRTRLVWVPCPCPPPPSSLISFQITSPLLGLLFLLRSCPPPTLSLKGKSFLPRTFAPFLWMSPDGGRCGAAIWAQKYSALSAGPGGAGILGGTAMPWPVVEQLEANSRRQKEQEKLGARVCAGREPARG